MLINNKQTIQQQLNFFDRTINLIRPERVKHDNVLFINDTAPNVVMGELTI